MKNNVKAAIYYRPKNEYILRAGTIVHVLGLPVELKKDTAVTCFTDLTGLAGTNKLLTTPKK